MPYTKNYSYPEMPFSANTPISDFYTYTNIRELSTKCQLQRDEITRCRTVGILQSVNGRFYLYDIDSNSNSDSSRLIQVSMVYLKSPPQSTVIPYPVQVFGMLQWKNRPIIFAKILQVLNVSTALRLNSALSGASTHLATVALTHLLKVE